MSDLSKIKLDGDYYNLKDAEARTALSQKLGKSEDAYRAASIPMGTVDSTSTSTAFTATVPGITELRDGVCVWLKNGKVTSAAGFTININNLGAKPVRSSMSADADPKTIFNVNYTMLFIYNSTRITGGCWDMVYGYFTNTTMAYGHLDYYFRAYAGQTIYRYKLLMQGADNRLYPIVTTNQSDATQVNKVPTTIGLRPYNIWYYTATTTVSAGGAIGAQSIQPAGYGTTAVYNFNESTGTYMMVYLCGDYNKDTDLFTLWNNGATPCKSYYKFVPAKTANIDLSSYFTTGKYYLLVGGTYSTTNYFTVFAYNPFYYFDGTNLIPVTTKITKDIVENSIPTDISDLTDSNGLIPDISSFISTETDPVYSASAAAGITSSDITTWNAKSDFSGSYNDLTNKPTIPEDKIYPVNVTLTSTTTGTSDKSHAEISAAVTAGKIPFIYITYGTIKMVAPLARVETNFSVFVYEDQTVNDHMNYANLTITGTTVSIVWRDKYITDGDIPTDISDLTDNSNIIPTVPTNISAFNNDAGFITSTDIPTIPDTSQFITAEGVPGCEADPIFIASPAGSITENDILAWNAKSDFTGSYTDLTDKPTIPAAQVQSDWNATTGMGVILNKPDTSTFMVKGTDYVTAGQKANTTLGRYASAEGYDTTASGDYSHAEGTGTTASRQGAHAEGCNTIASGDFSHAEGVGTLAQRKSQHVFGEYNVLDTTGANGDAKGSYIEIVGKGTADNARSNARTLDWSGNEVLAGKLTIGAAPTNNMDVATKQYVDNAIPTVPTNISSFTNDAGYLTSAPVTSVNTRTGAVTVNEVPNYTNNDLEKTLTLDYHWETLISESSIVLNGAIGTTNSNLSSHTFNNGDKIYISGTLTPYHFQGQSDGHFSGICTFGQSLYGYPIYILIDENQDEALYLCCSNSSIYVIHEDFYEQESYVLDDSYSLTNFIFKVATSIEPVWGNISPASIGASPSNHTHTPASIGAATSSHTHSTALATSTGTSSITLQYGGKYRLSAGGTGTIFTMPSAPTITNTLSSGTLIATINGTNIYAPSYTDGNEVSY